MSTPAQLKSGLSVMVAVADAIREAGEVPSGTLYAMLIGRVSFEGYESILRTLTGAGLIKVLPSHLIRWVGPASGDSAQPKKESHRIKK